GGPPWPTSESLVGERGSSCPSNCSGTVASHSMIRGAVFDLLSVENQMSYPFSSHSRFFFFFFVFVFFFLFLLLLFFLLVLSFFLLLHFFFFFGERRERADDNRNSNTKINSRSD